NALAVGSVGPDIGQNRPGRLRRSGCRRCHGQSRCRALQYVATRDHAKWCAAMLPVSGFHGVLLRAVLARGCICMLRKVVERSDAPEDLPNQAPGQVTLG